jgi:hypothetical protein
MNKAYAMFGSRIVNGILLILILTVLIGCASSSGLDFTPGALKNDIGGSSNLPTCQFFISKDVSIKYKRISRSTDRDRNGVVKADNIIYERTFNILKQTPGIFRYVDDANKPVSDSWTLRHQILDVR